MSREKRSAQIAADSILFRTENTRPIDSDMIPTSNFVSF